MKAYFDVGKAVGINTLVEKIEDARTPSTSNGKREGRKARKAVLVRPAFENGVHRTRTNKKERDVYDKLV